MQLHRDSSLVCSGGDGGGGGRVLTETASPAAPTTARHACFIAENIGRLGAGHALLR